MINQQSYISPKTAILEKLFNMCLPAISITLRKRCKLIFCTCMHQSRIEAILLVFLPIYPSGVAYVPNP